MSKTDLYAVMGNPIAHSKSPFIHKAFAKQVGHDIAYDPALIPTEENSFSKAVQEFQQLGCKGVNVTVPFKQKAWMLCHERSARAEKAGAVNTLSFDELGRCLGDNTDGVGLVRDFTKNHQGQLNNKRVLILGAGGAVRGILEPLLAEKPTLCTIANRTVSKAEELVQLFADEGTLIACSYDALIGQQFDVIINGTSASLQGELPPLPDDLLAEHAWCYDMMYAGTATPFITWALAHNAQKALDGLGMLVEQAAESFYIWRGIRPETQAVISRLRERIIREQMMPKAPQTIDTNTTTTTQPVKFMSKKPVNEVGGPEGPEPTRFGDWERKGRCIDF